ncbi:hypothetical protein BRARA_D02029 [Brassica rapa]|uniref:Uncharacterized protein n=1 Tax=Brassica campestris TaxID=3711 RepID=A0A397ZU38_BRACM|nr:hypothetical protein BRARA_D02029 [Brassica rapa]
MYMPRRVWSFCSLEEHRTKCGSDLRKEWSVYMLRIITNH